MKVFALGVLTFIALSSGSVQEQYAQCFSNYSVLEQAVYETKDNRYNIIRAFYSPNTTLPSVYVTVTYVSSIYLHLLNQLVSYSYVSVLHRYVSDDNIEETWLWTRIPIYLIQPASVFQFTSLLFNHHAISGRVQPLTVYLPGVCCDKTTVSCFSNDRPNNTHCNNRYLDVLTNEVRH